MKHMIMWFEIAVSDMERARKFYETIFGFKMGAEESLQNNWKMLKFPSDKGAISGGLLSGPGYKPSHNGSMVYLNGGQDLQVVQDKVVTAGGKVIKAKFGIGDFGFIAFIEDSEGNKIGLHSMK